MKFNWDNISANFGNFLLNQLERCNFAKSSERKIRDRKVSLGHNGASHEMDESTPAYEVGEIISTEIINDQKQLKLLIEEKKIKFLDFGCSHGEGLLWTQRKTGKTGLGVDIDPKKLQMAEKKGVLCCNTDILSLPNEKLVSFTTMFHVLEHLENLQQAEAFLRKGCTISRDCVYVRQPSFDSDSWLFQLGLKTFYSHWTGHKNRMTISDFCYILQGFCAEGLVRNFRLAYRMRIESSDSDKIHSLSSPKDSLHYDATIHPPKPLGLKFKHPVFYELIAGIDIGGRGLGRVWKAIEPSHIIYDSHDEKN